MSDGKQFEKDLIDLIDLIDRGPLNAVKLESMIYELKALHHKEMARIWFALSACAFGFGILFLEGLFGG